MPILTFPDTRQTDDFDCGASALQSVLCYYGIEFNESEMVKKLRTDKEEGTRIRNLIWFGQKSGLKVQARPMTIEDIKAWIDRRVPVILLIQAWAEDETIDLSQTWDQGHYVVAIGYDEERIFFNDPSILGNRGYLSFEELDGRWHDEDSDMCFEHWGIAFFGKKPDYDPNWAMRIQARRVAARWLGTLV